MSPSSDQLLGSTTTPNGTDTSQITPIVSTNTLLIFGYVNGTVLAVIVGVLGMLTNAANITVYLKMGLSETATISFFSLSIIDLLVSASTALTQLTYNFPVTGVTLPSGAPLSELGLGSCFILYPCLGCSAWVTAILSTERCLCIAMPLKVKEIMTPRRTAVLILVMVIYQTVLSSLMFADPGPPYDAYDANRALYFICSFSAPSLICFGVVLVSTTLLVVRLKQSLEWRGEATKQFTKGSAGTTKEQKAARSVIAICTIFIICFLPNVAWFVTTLVYPRFNQNDPYVGNLFRVLYSFSFLFQVISSSINILVYYNMSTKYREVFNALFSCRQRDK